MALTFDKIKDLIGINGTVGVDLLGSARVRDNLFVSGYLTVGGKKFTGLNINGVQAIDQDVKWKGETIEVEKGGTGAAVDTSWKNDFVTWDQVTDNTSIKDIPEDGATKGGDWEIDIDNRPTALIDIETDGSLDVSGGTFTTSAAQNLAIVQGVGANTDIGAYNFRANTLTADGQTSGRVAIYSTSGLLSEDADLLFSGSELTIGTDADGTDRSIVWGHTTLKTIMGVDDSADAFVINTDDAFDGTLANNSFSIDASHNVIIAGDVTVGDDLFLSSSGSIVNWNAGDITLTHSSGKLTLSGDGTVEIDFDDNEMTNVDIDSGAIDGVTLGTNSAVTQAQIDNININGGTINATSGDLTITAAGGDISFGDERLATTGTLGSGAITTTGRLLLDIAATTYTPSGDGILSHHEGGVIYTDSSTSTSGTAAKAILHTFDNGTLAATNGSVTTTDAATMYITNAPAAGTNMTLTNPYALWVDAGVTRLDGNLLMSSGQKILTDGAEDSTIELSGYEVQLTINQGGHDGAGDNRLRLYDNTTLFADITYDDGDTFRIESSASTDIDLVATGEKINFLSAAGTMVFNIDATPEIDVTGAFSIDCSSDITLDAAGNDIKFQAGATHELKFTNSSGSWLAAPQTSNASLTLSPNGTGDVICKLGNDVATSTFVVENSSATDRFVVDALGAVVITQASTAANPALKIDTTDVDVIGVDINASQTTANVVDIAAAALTTGNAIYINHDDSSTAAVTPTTIHLDFDKSGVVGDSETSGWTGLDFDMSDAATNHADSIVTMTGIDMDIVSANAQGTLTNLGASFTVTGADTNNGLEITTTDGGTDLKIMSSADSGDYFSIATTTHGATTFTTIDDNATAANLSLAVDGDIVLGAVGETISMSDNSTTRFTFNVDSTPELDVTGDFILDCSGDITLDAAGDQIIMMDATTTRFTFNLDATPEIDVVGNFLLDGSGTIELDAAGNVITLTSAKVHQQNPYAVGLTDGYMHRIDGIGQMMNMGDDDFIANYNIITNHDNITASCDASFADTSGAGWTAP